MISRTRGSGTAPASSCRIIIGSLSMNSSRRIPEAGIVLDRPGLERVPFTSEDSLAESVSVDGGRVVLCLREVVSLRVAEGVSGAKT